VNGRGFIGIGSAVTVIEMQPRRLLELARNAQRLFEKQNPREKRRLLNFVVSNCTWKGGNWSSPCGNTLTS
jgi:hypothetical protein